MTYRQRANKKGKFIYSKKALAITGTLEARFFFRVYKTSRGGRVHIEDYEINANSTSYNCLTNKEVMFRNAHKDAKFELFNKAGGSYKYTSKLMDYYFVYYNEEDYTSNYEGGHSHNLKYYNNQIPETERNYKYGEESKNVRQTRKNTKTRNSKTTKKNSIQQRKNTRKSGQTNRTRNTTPKRRISTTRKSQKSNKKQTKKK